MKIKLQKNTSEANRINKKINLILETEGTLKEECSLINPVVLIETNKDIINQFNYVTIPLFNRKYFVVNVEVVRMNIYRLHLHCDVLSSFADELKNCEAIVSKNENSYNLYIDDGSLQTYNTPIILTKDFPSGFNTTSYVLAVAGN